MNDSQPYGDSEERTPVVQSSDVAEYDGSKEGTREVEPKV